MKARRELLRKNNDTLQPVPVIQGSINDIKATYVAINDIVYRTNTYVEAITLCFKIFYAFNCEYPKNSQNIWKFIQKYFYDIDHNKEKFVTSINVLIGELRSAAQAHMISKT